MVPSGIRRKSIKLALQLKNFADMETPAMGFMLTGTAEGLVELQKHRKQLVRRNAYTPAISPSMKP